MNWACIGMLLWQGVAAYKLFTGKDMPAYKIVGSQEADPMNGSISVSTNDGWICEFAKDGENCFVIPEAPAHLSPEARDRSDRDNFYNILDDKILPLYYDHNDKWMDIVFNAMTDIYPEFDSDRMADQYYTEMYNS